MLEKTAIEHYAASNKIAAEIEVLKDQLQNIVDNGDISTPESLCIAMEIVSCYARLTSLQESFISKVFLGVAE